MKKLMSLREALHVMMQCYMRQHYADLYWLHEHPGGHASWREMLTTLLNTYPPKMIATILKALREQRLQDKYQKSLFEYDQILKGGKFWDDVNGGYLPEDHVLTARREEIDWVHSEGVYEIDPMLECRDTGMYPSDLIWVDSDKSVDPTRNKIRSTSCAREYKKKKQGMIQRALPASQFSLQCHLSIL